MNFEDAYRSHEIKDGGPWEENFVDFDKRVESTEKTDNLQEAAHSFESDQRIEPVESNNDQLSEIIDGIQPIEYRICRNESLEGQKHPETGVEFKRKIVELSDGRKIEGVFPKFDSKQDIQLPSELYKSSFFDQKAYLSNKMQEIANDTDKVSELKRNFTDEEIESFKQGVIPEGYIWHHNEEEGLMQLVDAETHDKTGHTGGMSIWGVGYKNGMDID